MTVRQDYAGHIPGLPLAIKQLLGHRRALLSILGHQAQLPQQVIVGECLRFGLLDQGTEFRQAWPLRKQNYTNVADISTTGSENHSFLIIAQQITAYKCYITLVKGIVQFIRVRTQNYIRSDL